jgi:hypothetical protein
MEQTNTNPQMRQPIYQQTSPPQRSIEIQPKSEKTLYNSSYPAVFFRNFLAGFARALGGLFIYLIFLAISLYSFAKYIYPEIKPIISSFEKISQFQNNFQPGQTGTTPQLNSNEVKEFLNQFQKQ